MRDIMNFRDLETWQAAMELVERCYIATNDFPREELYGLTSQLRRAAVSIPSNIAEGHARKSTRAFANHVSIALGSHAEFETCVEIARRLGFLTEHARAALNKMSESVGRLLGGLYRALEVKLARQGDASNPQPPFPKPR